MDELDQVWTNMLDEAALRVRSAGAGDVADYLALRSTNDFLRATSIRWLLESAAQIGADAHRDHPHLTFENAHPHKFSDGKANLVGWLVRFRQGVRCLSIEAGWTRAPSDGFMRGGALAIGRVAHFGLPKRNVDLILSKAENAPVWFAVDGDGRRTEFHSSHLQNHFKILLDAA